jgi:hypothetical protein
MLTRAHSPRSRMQALAEPRGSSSPRSERS